MTAIRWCVAEIIPLVEQPCLYLLLQTKSHELSKGHEGSLKGRSGEVTPLGHARRQSQDARSTWDRRGLPG